MRQHITHHSIVNKILMSQSHHRGSYLIVEGDTDARVYNGLTDKQNCRIIIAFGKHNAVKAILELEKRRVKGVLAIVDADFWRLEQIVPKNDNLLLTDTHDLETMILKSPALEKVISEYLPGNKIIDYTDAVCESLREIILVIGIPIGLLRWLSSQEDLDFVFKELPFHVLIDKKYLQVDQNQLLLAVNNASRKHGLTDIDIKNKIKELANGNHDPWHVCSGHDLIYILAEVIPIVLQKKTGERVNGKIRPNELDSKLRIAYEFTYFKLTQLYFSIRKWEDKNKSFHILPKTS